MLYFKRRKKIFDVAGLTESKGASLSISVNDHIKDVGCFTEILHVESIGEDLLDILELIMEVEDEEIIHIDENDATAMRVVNVDTGVTYDIFEAIFLKIRIAVMFQT